MLRHLVYEVSWWLPLMSPRMIPTIYMFYSSLSFFLFLFLYYFIPCVLSVNLQSTIRPNSKVFPDLVQVGIFSKGCRPSWPYWATGKALGWLMDRSG